MLEQSASERASETASSLAVRLAGLTRTHGSQEVYVFGSRAREIAARVHGFEREARPSVYPDAGAFLALAVVSGELLYCDNATEQAEYELYVLRRAGDLLPLERTRRELILSQGAR